MHIETFGKDHLEITPALNEYVETKSVLVELTGGTRDPFKLG